MRHILTLAAIFLGLTSQSQIVNITSNFSISGNTLVGQSNYSVTEAIYTSSEIGPSNFIAVATQIEKIGFTVGTLPVNPADAVVDNFVVYLKNVSPAQTTFPFSEAYSTSGYTEVFNGTISPTSIGVYEITLTTPFVRQFGTNLQVLVERKDNALHPGFTFFTSNGNNSGQVAFSSRTYNGTAAPVSGSTTLTQTFRRPAIRLSHALANDAGIRQIISPLTTSCYNSDQEMKVVLTNDGISTINAGAVQLTLKISGANSFTASATNPSTFVSGATDTITFTGVNLNSQGANIDTAFISMTGDQSTYNDTLITSHQTATTIDYASDSTLNVVEDVESSGSATILPFVQLLREGATTKSQLWTIQSGCITDNGNGFDLCPFAGSGGNKYFMYDPFLFLSAGLSSVDDISLLYSNCLSIPPTSTIKKTYITFNMTHDSNLSSFDDSLYVVVSDDRGLTWNTIGSYGRVDVTLPTTDLTWKTEEIEVPATYEGKVVQIGFKAVGVEGGVFGLDDINVLTRTTAVKAISFEAKRTRGTTVDLTWNVRGVDAVNFIVERSEDGRNYVSIGSVVAQNSSASGDYSFTDANPSKGNNYYRLRLISAGSKTTYSQVRLIRILDYTEMLISPNPISNNLSVFFESEKNEQITLIVSDMSGKVLLTQKANVTQGGSRVDIPSDKLGKGTYIVSTSLNGIRLVKKAVKL